MQLVVLANRIREVLQDMHMVAILKSTRRFLNLGRDFTGFVAEKTSRAGAKIYDLYSDQGTKD